VRESAAGARGAFSVVGPRSGLRTSVVSMRGTTGAGDWGRIGAGAEGAGAGADAAAGDRATSVAAAVSAPLDAATFAPELDAGP
jgi:hypothetical protein